MCVVGNHTTSISTVYCARIGRPPNNRLERTNGDGDCNCITWIERLGLPLLTGRMDEFLALPGRASHPSRRFGRCL